jgi:putative peptidoglycan lipid II flippase
MGERRTALMNLIGRVVARARELVARFGMSTDNRRVIIAAALVGVLTIFVKAASTFREILVAADLGTGDAAEAYIVAWVIPGFVSALIGDCVVSCLMPLYVSARAKRGDEIGEQVYAEILLLGVILLELATIVLALTPHIFIPLLASEFSPEKLALAERLWLMMLPAVFLGGLGMIWSGILNAENRFGLAAVSPIAAPLISILGLVLFPSHAVDALAIGFVLGYAAQVVMLGWELRRRGIRLTPAWYGGHPETRGLLPQFLPLAANNIVFNGLLLVDTAMAATLGDKNVATLTYGSRLIFPILGVTGSALGTVVFPHFSQMAANENWRDFQRTLSHYTRLIFVTMVPVTGFLILLSGPIVRIVFERGEFSAADTIAVSRVQATFALMISCYTLASVYSRVVVALRKSQLMLFVSIFVFGINLVGNYVLKEFLGVDGIALATVINYTIQAAVLGVICRRLLREHVAESEQLQPSMSGAQSVL